MDLLVIYGPTLIDDRDNEPPWNAVFWGATMTVPRTALCLGSRQ